MIEIFSHDMSFGPDEDNEGIYILAGKTWEGGPFQIYMKEEDAKNLIWQLGYYISHQHD